MQHEGEGGRGCESESAREIMQLTAATARDGDGAKDNRILLVKVYPIKTRTVRTDASLEDLKLRLRRQRGEGGGARSES